MKHFEMPETMTVIMRPASTLIAVQRANEILDALISTTSQQEYDEVTVEKLIEEYESLMS